MGVNPWEKTNQEAILATPYGRGILTQTKYNDVSKCKMNEIELIDWAQPSPTGAKNPTKLFSTTTFPPIEPQIGDKVQSMFGRGKIVEIRQDQILVVKISSWRLARRSMVTCYLSKDSVRVVAAIPLSKMNIHEKIEHAQDLKAKASSKFATKHYKEALVLYAKAVDSVRYVQHNASSSNENRADLLVVMITCCNNAGLSCYQLEQWEECGKFGQNALVLLDALHRKRETSNLLKLLLHDGFKDAKLFGLWRVKSLLLISRGLLGRSQVQDAKETLQRASAIIGDYKPIEPGLATLEKEVRSIYNQCRYQSRLNIEKEKRKARAMFGGGQTKNDGANTTGASNRSSEQKALTCISPKETDKKCQMPAMPIESEVGSSSTRKESIDNSSPGDDPPEDLSFVEKHKELLLCMLLGALGSVVVFQAAKRRW